MDKCDNPSCRLCPPSPLPAVTTHSSFSVAFPSSRHTYCSFLYLGVFGSCFCHKNIISGAVLLPPLWVLSFFFLTSFHYVATIFLLPVLPPSLPPTFLAYAHPDMKQCGKALILRRRGCGGMFKNPGGAGKRGPKRERSSSPRYGRAWEVGGRVCDTGPGGSGGADNTTTGERGVIRESGSLCLQSCRDRR